MGHTNLTYFNQCKLRDSWISFPRQPMFLFLFFLFFVFYLHIFIEIIMKPYHHQNLYAFPYILLYACSIITETKCFLGSFQNKKVILASFDFVLPSP